MSQFNIGVIPGDGIGTEVIPEGLKVLEAAASKHQISFNFTHFDWSCETYHRTGRMMPEDGLEQLKKFDAIFLG
ncbi:isocitrate/isopropylmalate family dehydrogenase, partial [Escherichia coli]